MSDCILEHIDACGFDAVGTCPAASLVVRLEVRDMCAADRCSMYARSWMCPPACGELDDFARRIAEHETCYVVQSHGSIEDSFDIEGMLRIERLQKRRFGRLAGFIRESIPGALLLSAGTCDLCPDCTYPDAPCRFPARALCSMEAAGLVVSDVCNAAGVSYNYGPETIAYTSCVLV